MAVTVRGGKSAGIDVVADPTSWTARLCRDPDG
jgi:hypothetical protein